jgi:hypothetical protein
MAIIHHFPDLFIQSISERAAPTETIPNSWLGVKSSGFLYLGVLLY